MKKTTIIAIVVVVFIVIAVVVYLFMASNSKGTISKTTETSGLGNIFATGGGGIFGNLFGALGGKTKDDKPAPQTLKPVVSDVTTLA